ncbi:MAG: hypothetical protein KHX36_09790 [Clostridiales bacterium]|nr:hypothetical protein [Clostridiales bacterium]
MKKYLAFFRLRFSTGLQYRAAALAGVATQFAWGFMRILMFRAFYEADPSAFPMSFQGLASYIWLQQAFLMLFSSWSAPTDIFESISSGQVAYEMCRPMNLYTMWWTKNCAVRLSKAALRFVPVVAVSFLLPAPYGLVFPNEPGTLFLFLLSLVLGLGVMVCMDMLMVDVTDVPEADMADDFVLLGAQGSERITPDELAEHAQTIPYEIMLGFSPRVRREWDNDEI